LESKERSFLARGGNKENLCSSVQEEKEKITTPNNTIEPLVKKKGWKSHNN